MGKITGKVQAALRLGPVKADGNYSILLRHARKPSSSVSSFSGDVVEAPQASASEDGAQVVVGTVTLTCRSQNVRVDQIDTGTRINDRVVYSYRLSFVGINHRFVSGDKALYDRLPVSIPIIMNCDEQPLTQWDGEDVEVIGGGYVAGGALDASSIVIPKLGGLKLVKGDGPSIVGTIIGIAVVLLVMAILSSAFG